MTFKTRLLVLDHERFFMISVFEFTTVVNVRNIKLLCRVMGVGLLRFQIAEKNLFIMKMSGLAFVNRKASTSY